jgi:CheY-like chemotaxis protein
MAVLTPQQECTKRNRQCYATGSFPLKYTQMQREEGNAQQVLCTREALKSRVITTRRERAPGMIPRILIIDDEADIREVTALSLETIAGWQVILAPSGAQGIRRASLEQPDAILLDVMMPDIDGPTTFQILKQNGNTAHIPVLLLTAKVQGQDRRKLDELGAAAILSKPFDPLTLADQISDILGWDRARALYSGPPTAISLAGD